ncbi:MAG TPA: outer membrane protein assembly factor BamE [Crenotrichaceae bacterium]|nr:outer membrane protein assembly factor BamE [Crenotrichaceae bacterium]
MEKDRIVFTMIASFFLLSCGIYKVDVQQGNLINQDLINQVRPRMTKRQVQYVLGTPLTVDPFHKDRWDYLFTNQPGGEDITRQQVSLIFKNNKLSIIEGDLKPGTLTVLEPKKDVDIIVPKRKIEKTILEKITSLFGLLDDEA